MGKQVAGSDLSEYTGVAGVPDNEGLDTVVNMCGFVGDLESRDEELPRGDGGGRLDLSSFHDGL